MGCGSSRPVTPTLPMPGSVAFDASSAPTPGSVAPVVTETVAAEVVAEVTYKVGSRIQGNWKGGGTWYDGIIVAANGDTFDIQFDDGDFEAGVPAGRLRLAAEPVVLLFDVGSRVQGNWKRGGTWYRGAVVAANGGTFDIQYDDGDFEAGVPVGRLRLIDDEVLQACQKNDVDLLQRTLERGVNSNGISGGRTGLHYAMANGLDEIVKILLAHPLIDVELRGNGNSPLHSGVQMYNVSEANARSCELLVAHPDVNVNSADSGGRTSLLFAANNSLEGAVKLLTAHRDIDVNLSNNFGTTPLHAAIEANSPPIVRLLLEARANTELRNQRHQTPLLMAASLNATDAAIAIINGGADVNAMDETGKSSLAAAIRTDDTQLVAALVARGADVTHVFLKLVACCLCGTAVLARDALASALADTDDASEHRDEVSPLTKAVLTGGGEGTAALDRADALRPGWHNMPAPIYFAIELGLMQTAEAMIAGSGLPEGVAASFVEAASTAIATANPDDSSGARYHQFLLAVIDAGLIDVDGCAPAKALVKSYIASIAGAAHMSATPSAFDSLKDIMEERLQVIAEPLDVLYLEEELAQMLGSLGAATQGKTIALDDHGLLPLPFRMNGYWPIDTFYEQRMLLFIVMASIAMDGLFQYKLRAALEKLGDSSEQAGSEVQIRKEGRLIITIMPAPVKTKRRMLNKLSNDHYSKPFPRPKWNVDTIRSGVVVEDAQMMGPVHDAINMHVGRFLRTKNSFLSEVEPCYGYRAFLGNLQLESDLTVDDVFGGAHKQQWMDWARAYAIKDESAAKKIQELLKYYSSNDKSLNFEGPMRDAPLNIVAEVQLIYAPYLHLGRKLSHLPYKVVRCEVVSELARDAGGKEAVSQELEEAKAACSRIVQEELAKQNKMSKSELDRSRKMSVLGGAAGFQM